MTTRLPISAFIIARDEESRIETAIRSVIDWVDEVIVVDSGSSDNTVDVAEKAGARVFYNEWNGYGLQKRYAEDQCRNTWLLNIDADEEVTAALRSEIAALFQPEPKADIYKVHIADVFPHERAAKPWAYGYWQFRLYDRAKGRFSESSVHDVVIPSAGARTVRLKGKMNHHSQPSISFFIRKIDRYSEMQVDNMLARNRRVSRIRLALEFPLAFLKSYIVRRGFMYGWWGVVNAHNFAIARFLRVAKFYQRQLIARSEDRR